MPESMREAVEGFEREQEEKRQREVKRAVATINGFDLQREAERATELHRRTVERLNSPEYRAALEPPRFRRADVLDLITAANDARQLAIAAPKLAEQANAQATRLSDLAERIAMLIEGDS